MGISNCRQWVILVVVGRKLLQSREQLMQRKAEALSILVDRGYPGSIEELIEESKRID